MYFLRATTIDDCGVIYSAGETLREAFEELENIFNDQNEIMNTSTLQCWKTDNRIDINVKITAVED